MNLQEVYKVTTQYNVLTDYIKVLEETYWPTKVEHAHWNLETGTICEINSECNGSGVLFNNIKHYPEGYRPLTHFIFKPKKAQPQWSEKYAVLELRDSVFQAQWADPCHHLYKQNQTISYLTSFPLETVS